MIDGTVISRRPLPPGGDRVALVAILSLAAGGGYSRRLLVVVFVVVAGSSGGLRSGVFKPGRSASGETPSDQSQSSSCFSGERRRPAGGVGTRRLGQSG